jgi:hypothetical protein
LQAPRDVAAPLDWTASIADFLRAYAYRVTGANFLGAALTETVHVQYGWLPLHGFAIIVTGLLIFALIKLHPPQRTPAVAVLLYIGISSLSFYLLRSTNFQLPFLLDNAPLVLSHRRYFLLASAALLVLIGMVLDGLPARYGRRAARRAAAIVVALLLLVFAPSLVEPAVSGPEWSQYGQLLDRWRDPVAAGGDRTVRVAAGDPRQWLAPPSSALGLSFYLPFVAGPAPGATVGIPISPAGWSSTLLVPARQLPFAAVGPYLLLADAQAQRVGDSAQVVFTWQYTGALAQAANSYWPLTLWLLAADGSADGSAVACQPMRVALPDPWLQPGQIFMTAAAMPLPAAAASPWRLGVSSVACPADLPVVVPPP